MLIYKIIFGMEHTIKRTSRSDFVKGYECVHNLIKNSLEKIMEIFAILFDLIYKSN